MGFNPRRKIVGLIMLSRDARGSWEGPLRGNDLALSFLLPTPRALPLLFVGPFPSLRGIVEPDLSRIEGLGIERLSDPLEAGLMPWVIGITNRLKEFEVTERPADVFRGTAPCSGDTDRIPDAGIGGKRLLQPNGMTPVVSEVVNIYGRRRFRGKMVSESNLPTGKDRFVTFERAVVRDSDSDRMVRIGPLNSELVEVAIEPAESILYRHVQVPEAIRRGHLDAPPDRRPDVQQGHLELPDCFSLMSHGSFRKRNPRSV